MANVNFTDFPTTAISAATSILVGYDSATVAEARWTAGSLLAMINGNLPVATVSTKGIANFGAGLSVSAGTVTANVLSVAGRTGNVTLSVADVTGVPSGSGTSTGVNTGDQVASTVPLIPVGTVAATNVQAAIGELDVEKASLSGATFTGNVSISGGNALQGSYGSGAITTNVAIGDGALSSNTTGNSTVAIGKLALTANTSGSNNVAVGNEALSSNTSGSRSTAVGAGALKRGTSAANNVAVGSNAMLNATTGSSNVAIGVDTLQGTTDVGSDNVVVGQGAVLDGTGSSRNVAVGRSTASLLAGGSDNTYVGYQAGQNATTSTKSVYVGSTTGRLSRAGSQNTAIGADAAPSLGLTSTVSTIVAGITYRIQAPGDTNFTLIGAADNNSGTVFTATGPGTGSGTVNAVTSSNTLIGSGTGVGLWAGSGNTFVGANIVSPTTSTSNNILIASGDGVVKARNNGTIWDMKTGLVWDHTLDTEPRPVRFTHSKVWSNTDPYLSGAVIIESSGKDNNQPTFGIIYSVSSTSIGNVGCVIWNTAGSTDPSVTASSVIAATIELLAPNTHITGDMPESNGKWELASVSGTSGGTGIFKTGYAYIGSRRSSLHPSGEDSGFETGYRFTPLSLTGLGLFTSDGSGIRVTPAYNYNADSTLTYTDTFNNVRWAGSATGAGKVITQELTGDGNSFSRVTSTAGTAAIYAQANGGNKNSDIVVRSNWVTPGSGASALSLFVDNTGSLPTGWRLSAGPTGTLSITNITSNVPVNAATFSTASDGLLTLNRISAATKGRLRLGNGAGSAGGGLVEYDSNTGVYALTGKSLTVNGTAVRVTSVQTRVALSGGGVAVLQETTDLILIPAGTIATYTVTLPGTPVTGDKKVILTTQAITTVTFNAASGTPTFSGFPSTLAAGGSITVMYVADTTTWYRIG